MSILEIIGRDQELFTSDIEFFSKEISERVKRSKFLVIGGAGSIGQAVTKEIFKRDPQALHVVDISENNMVELVRDLRSTEGYGSGDFRTFAVDCGSVEFEALMASEGPYDYVFNLSALKHVRSESDPYTLMRMIMVNVFNTIKTLRLANKMGAKKYFCVSTDKAANPVNMMGASKRIGEMIIRAAATEAKISISAVRFGNVLDSAGSVLPLFEEQIAMGGPVTVTHSDVERYFMTAEEASRLVLQATALNENQTNKDAPIYILEMGNPVKISHLARQLIRLRGLVPDRDIEIKYTGLRPGEKITETLMNHDESLESTYINGIKRLTEEMYTPVDMRDSVRQLIKALNEHDEVKVKSALFTLLPEFTPNGSLS